MTTEEAKQAAIAVLRWHAEMGVDETVATEPADFFSWRGPVPNPEKPPAAKRAAQQTATPASVISADDAPMPADEAVAAAKSAAAACATPEALAEAVAGFDGCPLKAGARNTVFADGVYGANLLILGEAPGRNEDRLGKPFVGRAGQLLDKMLAAIDRSRETNALISNVIFWRPPGNRTPTAIETAICRPFVDRLIELTAPKVIMLAGGAPLQAMLGVSGIMRSRGVWKEIRVGDLEPIATMPLFHPAFLLRQPEQKRLAWDDLLAVEARLTDD